MDLLKEYSFIETNLDYFIQDLLGYLFMEIAVNIFMGL